MEPIAQGLGLPLPSLGLGFGFGFGATLAAGRARSLELEEVYLVFRFFSDILRRLVAVKLEPAFTERYKPTYNNAPGSGDRAKHKKQIHTRLCRVGKCKARYCHARM